MSQTNGKDKKDTVLFVTRAEHEDQSSVSLPKEEGRTDLILPSGDINWSCPCLNGMATGPCGVEFRDAFECFHQSQATPQGKDCLEKFHAMQDCMQEHPRTYKKEDLPHKPPKPRDC